MDLSIMGNVEVLDGRRTFPLARAGERCVLATLAMSPGRRVHIDTLIWHIWDDQPPANAERTVASYTRAVRRAIEQSGGQRGWLVSRRPGAYELDVPPELIDYHRFTALVATAHSEERAGRPVEAVARYEQAMGLRRGEALADVTGPWAENCRYAIEQEYLAALCGLYEQQLAIGQFSAVATSATHVIAEVIPTDRMIVLAVRALAGSGQHATINEFLDRASQRMWDTAEVRPSTETLTIARELVAYPDARLAPLGQVPTGEPADLAADESEESVDAAIHERTPDVPAQASHVSITANNNGQVFQAAGDQFISWPLRER
jgi:DNA-binding SARP family transcriptional activator